MKRWYALGTLLMIIGFTVGLTRAEDQETSGLALIIIVLAATILSCTAVYHITKD